MRSRTPEPSPAAHLPRGLIRREARATCHPARGKPSCTPGSHNCRRQRHDRDAPSPQPCRPPAPPLLGAPSPRRRAQACSRLFSSADPLASPPPLEIAATQLAGRCACARLYTLRDGRNRRCGPLRLHLYGRRRPWGSSREIRAPWSVTACAATWRPTRAPRTCRRERSTTCCGCRPAPRGGAELPPGRATRSTTATTGPAATTSLRRREDLRRRQRPRLVIRRRPSGQAAEGPRAGRRALPRRALGDLAACPCVTIDAALVQRAAARSAADQLSHWDALIVEAAVEAGADVLVSEDFQASRTYGGVRVEDPFAS